MTRVIRPGERALWQAVTADVTSAKPKIQNRRGAPVPAGCSGTPITKAGTKPGQGALPARSGSPAICVKQPAGQYAKELKRGLKREPVRHPAGRSLPAQQLHPPVSSRYASPVQNICLDDAIRARKVARGGLSIAARLDLHGLTQDEALEALADFLGRAQARSCRCVLIITGKGLPRRAPARAQPGHDILYHNNSDHGILNRGILRQQLPIWIQTRFSDKVISMAPAHTRHGGGGAFYLFLRKAGQGVAVSR